MVFLSARPMYIYITIITQITWYREKCLNFLIGPECRYCVSVWNAENGVVVNYGEQRWYVSVTRMNGCSNLILDFVHEYL